MNTRIVALGFIAALAFAIVAHSCTAFLASHRDVVLAGNNEDYINPQTRVRFVPSEDGRLGRIYFGFDNLYLQGGMNERGLFFDGFATAPRKVVQHKLGSEHLYAPNHMEGLAFEYWERGDREKALEINKRAVEIYQRDPDVDMGLAAGNIKSLAWMYTELGHFSEVEDLYLNDLELKSRMQRGDENLSFLQKVGELDTMYRKWEKHEKTEQWLKQAKEIAHRVFGDNQKITNKIVNNLIDLYEAWGKPEKVKGWQAKLPQTEAVDK
jgi:tetratricopeptide (TPR) repeat protein